MGPGLGRRVQEPGVRVRVKELRGLHVGREAGHVHVTLGVHVLLSNLMFQLLCVQQDMRVF